MGVVVNDSVVTESWIVAFWWLVWSCAASDPIGRTISGPPETHGPLAAQGEAVTNTKLKFSVNNHTVG